MKPSEKPRKKPAEPKPKDEQEEARLAEEREKINAQLLAIGNPKGKAVKKNIISGIVLLVMMIIMVLSIVLSTGELGKIGEELGKIGQGSNYVWLIGGFMAALVFFLLYPFSLLILSKSFDPKSSSSDAYLIGAGEHFFNGITPFAAGGQPIQIYDFSKKGMKPGVATGLVMTNFILYLGVLNVYEVLAFIYWEDINQAILASGWDYWSVVSVAIIGYVFNLGFLAFIIALGVSKRLAKWLVSVARWFCRFKLIGKFLTPAIPRFEIYCSNVQSTIKGVFHHKKAVVEALIIKIIVYGIYFALPYFIINAFGHDLGPDKIFETMMVTSFASSAVCWVPTPGATGGIEFAFAIAVGAVLPGIPNLAAVGNSISLIWRLLTFYFVLLLSLGAVIIFESGFQVKLRKDVARSEKEKEELLQKLEKLDEEIKQVETEETPAELPQAPSLNSEETPQKESEESERNKAE